MEKILLIIIWPLILAVVLVVIYCAVVVAGRSDERGNNVNNSNGYDNMFLKKKICPKCKTGKDSYELDKHSETCPYIDCWKNGKCYFFVPLENTPKKDVVSESTKGKMVIPPKG